MTDQSRIRNKAFADKVMSADQAAMFIEPGANVGMSGFTGAGYPKEVPAALVRRVHDAKARGERYAVSVWTGASTSAELDGAMAEVDGIDLRMPYQSDPISRAKINAGLMDYVDLHLSHVAQMVWQKSFGHLDMAVIEIAGITEDGKLIPSSSVGNNKTWIDQAKHVILEVNSGQPLELEGMHDVYYGTALPPDRKPIQITGPFDRIGQPYFNCPLDKVVAVVETNSPDRNSPFKDPDADSKMIANHILDFFAQEVKGGRLPATLLPLQSGVGNIANAVLMGLDEGPFRPITAYTEVIQDGMLQLLKSGTMSKASCTAFSLSEAGMAELCENIDDYRERIILRPQEISNHPEVIRRLGCLSMNGMIEADMYGNINSTHLMGSSIMNGIGGSGDFARNAYISMFMTPSVAKRGAISCIVPMVSHVDHTEHDAQIIVTEQGLADLRGLPPRRRAKKVIDNCAHPDYRPALHDYFDRASASASGLHTPHMLDEALSWHSEYLKQGTMQSKILSPAR
jgi:succinyl-CoA:acetate CoA-transferase